MAENVSSIQATYAPPIRRRSFSFPISERRALLMMVDLLMLSAALFASLWLRIPDLRTTTASWHHFVGAKLRWWLVLWGLWVPVSVMVGCYDLKRSARAIHSAMHCGGAAAGVCILYFLVPIVSAPLTYYGRLTWFVFALLGTVSVVAWRILYAKTLAHNAFAKRVLVVGAGASGQALAKVVSALGEGAPVEVVGFVDDNRALYGRKVGEYHVLATSERLLDLVQQLDIDEVAVAITDYSTFCPSLLDALVHCWEQGVRVTSMPLLFEEVTGALPVDHIGNSLFSLASQQSMMVQRAWGALRRLVDIIFAIIGLGISIILLPFIALAIYLDYPGPIFYQQTRVGQGGRSFVLTKFRSMIPNAEAAGARWCSVGDDRITRVGRFMRKTRLDELPQLWNILIGDMTLIGPRPERPEFVPQLGRMLPYYRVRHSVKPGLTGWAQVRYPYASTIEDTQEKLKYDLYYIKHRGPLLDALIVLFTVRTVLQMQGR